MNRSVLRFAAIVCTVGAFATCALATQVIHRTPKELAQESALVVDGRVASVRSYWNDDRSKIFTEATVSVGSTYKGTAPASLRIVQLGGVVGNVRMTAHGAVEWKKGEEVLLFLEPSTPGAFQVAGFSQGKYLVERDVRNGRAYVKHALPVDAAKAGGPSLASSADEQLTLEQFLDTVFPRN